MAFVSLLMSSLEGGNLVDVLASVDWTAVFDLQVSDAGLVYDHKLLLFKAKISCHYQPLRHI